MDDVAQMGQTRQLGARRIAVLATAAAALLGVTLSLIAGTAAVAAVPQPSATPAPTSTGSASPPPIALQPPGSVSTGPLIGVKADDGAAIVAVKWLDLRTVDITVQSPAMGAKIVTRVLVPPGWTQTPVSTWPIVYLLHGGADDYTSWTRETTIAALSASWNVLVAMPDAGQIASYTDYFKAGNAGKPLWETFHTVELRQILERGFGASDQRAVGGLSSGGFGSMSYAVRHPGMFRFAASYSGAVSIRSEPSRTALLTAQAVQDGDPYARFGVPLINESVWAEHDPLTNAARLRGVSLYLSSGFTGIPSADDTVQWNPEQFVEVLSGSITQMLSDRLKRLKIPVTTDIYPLGEHAWVAWNRELARSWPQMMTAIGGRHF